MREGLSCGLHALLGDLVHAEHLLRSWGLYLRWSMKPNVTENTHLHELKPN